jgi:hypothetical protein
VNLSAAQLVQLAQAAGTGGDPRIAAAVALAESGGDPAAVGTNSDQWRSRDRGLWQINDHWHPEVSDACAFDATCNARAAYVISNGWTDFHEWATFQSGAYLKFMPQVASVTQQPPPARSLYGQTVVGQMLTSPWFPGSWEVTQGWGPTDYGGEPEGHGYQHWHAGVDVGVDCGTTITLPMGLAGTARALDNPGGYGTALIVLLDQYGVGVLLGHLRQRLVDDGTQVTGGTQLAVSNSTGNSTGCHVHFEVRPLDPKSATGIGRYGTDVDPSQWITAGQAGTSAELLSSSSGPLQGFNDAIQQAMRSLVAGGEVLLGGGMLLGGLIVTVYGLRGQSPQELQRDAGRTARSLSRPKRRPAPQGPREPTSPAAESRIRPDLQSRAESGRRRSGALPPGVTDLGGARVRRVRPMTAAEARVAAVRGRR